jgi:hypothetical protein
MKEKLVSRRWRTVAVLALGVAIGAVLFATPAASHIGSVSHLWSDHIKPKADARYLQNTKVVISSGTANNGQHDVTIVDCPAGYQATGGGVDPNNVLTMAVTSSGPTVNGERTLLTANGTHGPADGWWGAVVNNSGSAAAYKVSVICSK